MAQQRMKTKVQEMRNLAGLELNALVHAQVLPVDVFQKARISAQGTPIYDINGEILFHRTPIMRGQKQVAYADVAANPVFNDAVLAVSYGQVWDEDAARDEATRAAHEVQRDLKFDTIRFVAYSYPKIAVQFLLNGAEVLMLEWHTWQPVPVQQAHETNQARKNGSRNGTPPSNFERWSLVEYTPEDRRASNFNALQEKLGNWRRVQAEVINGDRPFRATVVDSLKFERLFEPVLRLNVDTRELRYRPDTAEHTPCFQLRGQITNVWCVAASVQMLLDFYRYYRPQTTLAADLGLGTINNPNGLPYSQDTQVVTVLEDVTDHGLEASMNTSPTWNEFVAEIQANHPLISFIPGHSRAVAGYTSTSLFGWFLFRGLLVYDPWPPTTGVITRWENFDTQTYRRTFSAQLAAD